MGNKRIF